VDQRKNVSGTMKMMSTGRLDLAGLLRKRNRQLSIIRVQARCNFVTLRPNPVLAAAELRNRECILCSKMLGEEIGGDLHA
jgi:hypothetical protein